jgi:hypothetical protein
MGAEQTETRYKPDFLDLASIVSLALFVATVATWAGILAS